MLHSLRPSAEGLRGDRHPIYPRIPRRCKSNAKCFSTTRVAASHMAPGKLYVAVGPHRACRKRFFCSMGRSRVLLCHTSVPPTLLISSAPDSLSEPRASSPHPRIVQSRDACQLVHLRSPRLDGRSRPGLAEQASDSCAGRGRCSICARKHVAWMPETDLNSPRRPKMKPRTRTPLPVKTTWGKPGELSYSSMAPAALAPSLGRTGRTSNTCPPKERATTSAGCALTPRFSLRNIH